MFEAKHKPMPKADLDRLAEVLRSRGGVRIGRDTEFAGADEGDADAEAETINAIRSVPCHY